MDREAEVTFLFLKVSNKNYERLEGLNTSLPYICIVTTFSGLFFSVTTDIFAGICLQD